MSTYYFSTTTRGFYTPDVHGTNMPPGAVEVTEQEWRALLDAQSRGMELRGDENGRPTAVHPEAP